MEPKRVEAMRQAANHMGPCLGIRSAAGLPPPVISSDRHGRTCMHGYDKDTQDKTQIQITSSQPREERVLFFCHCSALSSPNRLPSHFVHHPTDTAALTHTISTFQLYTVLVALLIDILSFLFFFSGFLFPKLTIGGYRTKGRSPTVDTVFFFFCRSLNRFWNLWCVIQQTILK